MWRGWSCGRGYEHDRLFRLEHNHGNNVHNGNHGFHCDYRNYLDNYVNRDRYDDRHYNWYHYFNDDFLNNWNFDRNNDWYYDRYDRWINHRQHKYDYNWDYRHNHWYNRINNRRVLYRKDTRSRINSLVG